jgi:hypothetical protein
VIDTADLSGYSLEQLEAWLRDNLTDFDAGEDDPQTKAIIAEIQKRKAQP